MTREIEIFAELSVFRNGRKILINAESNSVLFILKGYVFFAENTNELPKILISNTFSISWTLLAKQASCIFMPR